MKKVLCSILIFILLVNSIFAGFSHAETDFSEKPTGMSPHVYSQTDSTDPEDEGKPAEKYQAAPSEETGDTQLNDGGVGALARTAFGAVIGYLALLLDVVPLTIYMLMSFVTIGGRYNRKHCR